MNFVICGTVRNPNRRFEKRLLQLCDQISALPGSYISKIVLVESDSSKTFSFERAASKYEMNYLKLGRLRDSIRNRVSRLAYCRDKALEEVKAKIEADYVVVVDLDFGSYKQIDCSLAVTALENHSGVFANTNLLYYDLLALTKKKSLAFPIQKKSDFRGALSHFAKMQRLHPHQPPVEVTSGFGGLAFYHFDSVLPASYQRQGIDSEKYSEHWVLNTSLCLKRGPLAVVPGLVIRGVNKHILLGIIARFLTMGTRVERPLFPS